MVALVATLLEVSPADVHQILEGNFVKLLTLIVHLILVAMEHV